MMTRQERGGLEDFTITNGVVSVLQYSAKHRHNFVICDKETGEVIKDRYFDEGFLGRLRKSRYVVAGAVIGCLAVDLINAFSEKDPTYGDVAVSAGLIISSVVLLNEARKIFNRKFFQRDMNQYNLELCID